MRVALDQGSLDSLASAVDRLGDAAAHVDQTVAQVRSTTDGLGAQIATVRQEFDAYRAFDTAQKNLLNAKAELVKVRMELDEKFGINKEIRRYLTGILEASDLTIVRTEVIKNCTEKMMMDCKGYWLAPCLVALAAWLDDNQELAQRALAEAMKRDDEKTSLLFALICRRIGRQSASVVWLERYLAMQDPRAVERKMVTVLDAYSNGLFGQQAKEICEEKIEAWIEEMEAEPGFVEAQQKSWEESIWEKRKDRHYNAEYPYSAKHVSNWQDCEKSLNETDLHQIILEYFRDIFEKKNASNAALNDRLDQLMENYITSYDNEELPLRRRERELELIIEERGMVDRARERLASEQKALDEVVDFTRLLTAAAMHADVIKASNATQRLAIALSKDWIIPAYENCVLRARSAFPDRYQIEIEGWKGESVDGSEEEALSESARKHFSALRAKEFAAAKQSRLDIILPAVCGVLALASLITGAGVWAILLLLGAAGLTLRWYLNRKALQKKKEDIHKKYTQLIADVKNIIRALCAERVDYLRQLQAQDAVSEETLEYLRQIEAVQYTARPEGRALHAV